MKRLSYSLLCTLGMIGALFSSCSKSQIIQSKKLSASTVVPLVQDCGPGFHWSYSQGKCVADSCQTGYHWDNVEGKCIVNEIYVISNSNNPDDSAGNRHDFALNTLFPKMFSNITQEQINEYAINYLYPFGYDTSYMEEVPILVEIL